MKKSILIIFVIVFNFTTAQIPVWINEFNDTGDLQGWTFHDLNNNGNQWVQGANWHIGQANSYQTIQGNSQVLRHSVGTLNNTYVNGAATEDDWVISPAIDLTGAGGDIQLAVYWRHVDTRANTVGRYIYISESPLLSEFQNISDNFMSPYYMYAGNTTFPTNMDEFAEKIFDISQFAGKTIYIGLRTFPTLEEDAGDINIDQMAIFAGTLGTNDTKSNKSLTKVKQNPVAAALQLQLNPGMSEGKTQVQVYNAAGQQVQSAKYSREIPVAQLVPGMYIAVVTDGTLTERIKFIKK